MVFAGFAASSPATSANASPSFSHSTHRTLSRSKKYFSDFFVILGGEGREVVVSREKKRLQGNRSYQKRRVGRSGRRGKGVRTSSGAHALVFLAHGLLPSAHFARRAAASRHLPRSRAGRSVRCAGIRSFRDDTSIMRTEGRDILSSLKRALAFRTPRRCPSTGPWDRPWRARAPHAPTSSPRNTRARWNATARRWRSSNATKARSRLPRNLRMRFSPPRGWSPPPPRGRERRLGRPDAVRPR